MFHYKLFSSFLLVLLAAGLDWPPTRGIAPQKTNIKTACFNEDAVPPIS